jgi:hypothetical protein
MSSRQKKVNLGPFFVCFAALWGLSPMARAQSLWQELHCPECTFTLDGCPEN